MSRVKSSCPYELSRDGHPLGLRVSGKVGPCRWNGSTIPYMTVGRSARRLERQPRVERAFGKDIAPAVLDLLELTELAWHDCYGEISPPEEVVDDILLCAQADLAKVMHAARLAVEDVRDLKMWALALKAPDPDRGIPG